MHLAEPWDIGRRRRKPLTEQTFDIALAVQFGIAPTVPSPPRRRRAGSSRDRAGTLGELTGARWGSAGTGGARPQVTEFRDDVAGVRVPL